ncbi:MAG: DUF2914 domain-containing protein [Alphaproteobacteria bacterium]
MIKRFLIALCAIVAFAGIAQAEGISRSAFTSAIEAREPVDHLQSASKSQLERLSFFTEISGKTGETIYHKWHNGDVEFYSHSFNVGSARWRVNSNVSINHFYVGDTATVSVEDAAGTVLDKKTISIIQ